MKGLATTWVNVTNVVLSDVTDLFSVPRAVFYNLSLFVLPIPSRLSFEHDIVLSTSLWDPWTTLPTIIALLILCALPLVWIRRSPLFSLGLAWFLVLFLLEALVVKHNLVFEHRFYLPSMGLFLILGILVEKALRSRWRTIAVSTLVLLVAASSWITYQRNTVWQTQLTLMRDATAKAPQKIRARTGLVAALASAGHLMEARKEFREAMTLPLTSNRDLFNLGEAGVGVGEYDQAVTVLQRLAEIDPRSCGTPRYYLAEAYYRKRDVVKALENLHVFERCKDTLGWTRRRASALSEEIVSHLEQELRARPSDATNRMALANTLITRRQPAEAIPHLRTVIELEPGNVAAWASLGFSLFDLGEYTQAESCHRRAIGLQPRFPAPYYGLGQALVMQQRPAEAIPHFQRYLELAPRGDAFRVVAERYLRDLVGGS
jgi:tetratricopeptide (TPR) repeat protein